MSVEVKITDTRSVQVSIPATREDTLKFTEASSYAASAGYVLKEATVISGGSQRDPYTVGIRLTFSK